MVHKNEWLLGIKVWVDVCVCVAWQVPGRSTLRPEDEYYISKISTTVLSET